MIIRENLSQNSQLLTKNYNLDLCIWCRISLPTAHTLITVDIYLNLSRWFYVIFMKFFKLPIIVQTIRLLFVPLQDLLSLLLPLWAVLLHSVLYYIYHCGGVGVHTSSNSNYLSAPKILSHKIMKLNWNMTLPSLPTQICQHAENKNPVQPHHWL